MFQPRSYVETDLRELDALIARDAFITLVTVRDGAPEVNHLPVLYRRDGDRIELRGHWSAANPQAKQAGPALAIVHGPHAYISPGWYPDKQPEARVPTWNYVVAHLHGTLETFRDEEGLATLVDELSAHHEATVGGDWRFDFDRPEERRQLRGIVGFRLLVERAELKFKLSQNHPLGNRQSVVERLAAIGGEAGEVAEMMRARLALAPLE
ncbi:MAG TPA: FMN-binding negative transcriptional regulator [Lysobacter sp.]|nr:FMN-binding negative transcriptional regulator [Lysobacter sp.]